MAAKQKPHVFLSYVREDAERVERLAADLEARGIGTWLDRDKIQPGQRWQKAIEDAIRSGAFFVACFSQAYAARTRTHMNEELLIAIAEVRLRPAETSWFIPIRLDECEIPDRRIGPELTIRSFQWLDMFPDWARSVDSLVEAIGPFPRPELLAPSSERRKVFHPELQGYPRLQIGQKLDKIRDRIKHSAMKVESCYPAHKVDTETLARPNMGDLYQWIRCRSNYLPAGDWTEAQFQIQADIENAEFVILQNIEGDSFPANDKVPLGRGVIVARVSINDMNTEGLEARILDIISRKV
jgi:hypothetical protein